MRKTTTLLLSIATSLAQAQLPGDTLVMDFDDGATLVLDSVYPEGCWQVGMPSKPLFASALSQPRALVTDTVEPYPESSTCYAEFTLITDEGLGYYGRWIEFDHWLDIAPNTHAWLELGSPWSGDWYRFGLSGDDGWLSGNALWTPQGYEFDPSATGWQHVILDSPCIGVLDGGNERWYDPIMRLRFVFVSSDNPQGQDGWMIDDVRATATICSGGIGEEALGHVSIDPVPANNLVRLTFGSRHAGACTIEVLSSDGRSVLVKRTVAEGTVPLDVSGLDSGYYLCRVSNGSSHSTARLVVER